MAVTLAKDKGQLDGRFARVEAPSTAIGKCCWANLQLDPKLGQHANLDGLIGIQVSQRGGGGGDTSNMTVSPSCAIGLATLASWLCARAEGSACSESPPLRANSGKSIAGIGVVRRDRSGVGTLTGLPTAQKCMAGEVARWNCRSSVVQLRGHTQNLLSGRRVETADAEILAPPLRSLASSIVCPSLSRVSSVIGLPRHAGGHHPPGGGDGPHLSSFSMSGKRCLA